MTATEHRLHTQHSDCYLVTATAHYLQSQQSDCYLVVATAHHLQLQHSDCYLVTATAHHLQLQQGDCYLVVAAARHLQLRHSDCYLVTATAHHLQSHSSCCYLVTADAHQLQLRLALVLPRQRSCFSRIRIALLGFRLNRRAMDYLWLYEKFWVQRWNSWDAHLQRHPELPASKLLLYRDMQWLEAQRLTFVPSLSVSTRAWTSAAGRTATRAAPGFIAMRWAQARNFSM